MKKSNQKTNEKPARTITDDLTYEQLKAMVPGELKKKFEEIEEGRRLPELHYDRPFKSIRSLSRNGSKFIPPTL